MKRHYLYYLLAILIISTMSAGLSFAESAQYLVAKGNSSYNAGNYDEALSAYDQAAKEMPSDARIEFNRGAAFFRKGELDKAKDAWEKAALGATDVPMEAESLYNLGTLEFSKLTQAQAADLKAALKAGDRSVRYYHEATDLIANSPKYNNNPLAREASENIELVRRSMKTIQEEMARREEAAKNQAQAAEDLKKLIDQQEDLNKRTQCQSKETQSEAEKSSEEKSPEAGQQESAPLDDMAREQSQLQEQTQKTAEKLTRSDAASPSKSPSNQTSAQTSNPTTPDPAQAAKDHLAEAQARQKDAADKLTAGQASKAAKDQDAALEKMKNALDLLQYKDDQNKDGQGKDGQGKDGQGKDGQGKDGQGKDDRKQQSPSSDSEKQTEKGEKKQDAEPQNQQGQAAAENSENPASDSPMVLLPDDSERILNEEKENKKIRQQVSWAGGYQDVDKDW